MFDLYLFFLAIDRRMRTGTRSDSKWALRFFIFSFFFLHVHLKKWPISNLVISYVGVQFVGIRFEETGAPSLIPDWIFFSFVVVVFFFASFIDKRVHSFMWRSMPGLIVCALWVLFCFLSFFLSFFFAFVLFFCFLFVAACLLLIPFLPSNVIGFACKVLGRGGREDYETKYKRRDGRMGGASDMVYTIGLLWQALIGPDWHHSSLGEYGHNSRTLFLHLALPESMFQNFNNKKETSNIRNTGNPGRGRLEVESSDAVSANARWPIMTSFETARPPAVTSWRTNERSG